MEAYALFVRERLLVVENKRAKTFMDACKHLIMAPGPVRVDQPLAPVSRHERTNI